MDPRIFFPFIVLSYKGTQSIFYILCFLFSWSQRDVISKPNLYSPYEKKGYKSTFPKLKCSFLGIHIP